MNAMTDLRLVSAKLLLITVRSRTFKNIWIYIDVTFAGTYESK